MKRSIYQQLVAWKNAEENVKSKSLRTFVIDEWPELHLSGLRCSTKPFADQGWMHNIPLYGMEGFFRV